MIKRLQSVLEGISIPLLATILGLVAGSIFIAAAGISPVEVYNRLACEGFGSEGCESFGDLFVVDVVNEDTEELEHHVALFYGEKGHALAEVLQQATPLILTALAATVAFKAGMFSIGMDGQFALGAVVAAFLGYWLPEQIYLSQGITDPETVTGGLYYAMRIFMPAMAILAAMLAGALYSWLAGILKVKLSVNELISTIILNAIAVQFVTYLLNGPLNSDRTNIAKTQTIDDSAWLVPFSRSIFADVDWFNGSRLGAGIILAILAGVLIWYYLWRTTAGYEQRMVQGAQKFAQFGGVPAGRAVLRAMLISGALSGLAGAIQILGVERRMVDGFVSAGTGFDGVLIAILARESIGAIFVVAVLYAGLQIGSINLQFGNIPRQLGGIIIALIILFNSMETFIRGVITRIRVRAGAIGSRSLQTEEVPAAGGD
jgi:general nucleoside transport system permease protein